MSTMPCPAVMTETKCCCEKCKSMCAHSSCVPTPDEARALIKRGYADRMACFMQSRDGVVSRYVAPRFGADQAFGPCTFFRDGLCELHDIGLKPLEGRLAHHSLNPSVVRSEVLRHWRGKTFESVEKQLMRHVGVSS